MSHQSHPLTTLGFDPGGLSVSLAEPFESLLTSVVATKQTTELRIRKRRRRLCGRIVFEGSSHQVLILSQRWSDSA